MKGFHLQGRRKVLFVSLAGVALGTAITGGAIASAASSHTVSASTDTPSAAVHVFARNATGLSYGSELDAATPADAPNLILAYATNGKLGYVLKTDLHPELALSPSAALSAQAARTQPTFIPVYAIDGKTVIGEFKVTPPSHR